MHRDDFDATLEDLRAMITSRLSLRARSFERAVAKAGRLLPLKARDAAQDLIALKARLAHPRLAARTDFSRATEAARTIRTALARHRPGIRASQARTMLVAEVGFRVLVIVIAGLAVLQWQSPQ